MKQGGSEGSDHFISRYSLRFLPYAFIRLFVTISPIINWVRGHFGLSYKRMSPISTSYTRASNVRCLTSYVRDISSGKIKFF